MPLERLGFDSLQATELQARLDKDLGVRIPVLRLLGFATAWSISEEVRERLAGESLAAALPESDVRICAASPRTEAHEPSASVDAEQILRRSQR